MHRSSPLLSLLVACAGSSSPTSEGSGSAASACPDAEIAKRGEASLAASLRYVGLLEKLGTGWTGDCEAARIQFLALEPEGKRFMDVMVEAKEWGGKLAPECLDRVKERWEKGTAPEIDARAPRVQSLITTILDKCEGHPGFKDAVGRGLRVMRKKS